jgi:EmrB/QacA subfamily drug resistance transporter
LNFAVRAQCDAAAARSVPPRGGTKYPGLVLTTSILASSLAFIDGSVVNVGLSVIRDSLHADASALQWVINAYLLPLSALLLLGGAVGDRFGSGRVLCMAIAAFGSASILCAVAHDLPWLLVGRVLQGTAAAFVLPNSLAVLGESFSGEARGRAIGLWASAGAGVGAVGPVIGGALIDHWGWRMIFVINIPVSLVGVLLAIAVMRDAPRDETTKPLDLLGGLLATAALGTLTYALTVGTGRDGWTFPALLALAIGVVLLAAFVRTEILRADRAMIPIALFASREFVGISFLTLFLYGALSALLVLVPYVLISTAHYSNTAAGAALLPAPILMAVISPLAGSIAGRIGSRPMLVAGPLLVAAGFLLLLFVQTDGDYWTTVLPGLIAISLGMSAVAAPLTTAVLAAAGPANSGSASGFNSAIARLGGLIATALLGGVLGASGAALVAGFHGAAIVAAIASVLASASALALRRQAQVQ